MGHNSYFDDEIDDKRKNCFCDECDYVEFTKHDCMCLLGLLEQMDKKNCCKCCKGHQGAQGVQGAQGSQGSQGIQGSQGTQGAQGVHVGVVGFADFYALMPPNNSTPVAFGSDVEFPQDGPTSGAGIVRTTSSTFRLSNIGTYQVFFQVSITEAGQLVLTLDSGGGAIEQPYTVVGRATGTSQIVGMALVQTSVINSILTVRNPASETTALTITPSVGGTNPVSAHLVITQIA